MHTFLFQNWPITVTALLDFKRQTFVVCAILLRMLERKALIPLEVNLKKETSTLLWYWPCSGKLPCFPLPTLQCQCEMFTSRIRLNVSFLRSLTLVLSMYISEKKRAIRLTNKATCESLDWMRQFFCVKVTLTLTFLSGQHSKCKASCG